MSKVLMFHRILPQQLISEPNAYSTFGTLISQEHFEEVLQLIIDSGYQFVTVSKLTELNNIKSNTDKLIALTFDDGYSDNFEFAFPSLNKFNATATFFPIVNPCKENSVLPLDIYYQCVDEMDLNEEEREEYINGTTKKQFYWTDPAKQFEMLKQLFQTIPNKLRVSYMNAQQLKTLSNNGFEIGSHGMTHSLLIADYINEQKIISEFQNSKQWLEEVTGKPINSFCFPAGRYNNSIIELAESVGYTSTCLVYRTKNEAETLTSYERIFVKSNSLVELKSALNVQ